MERDSIIYRTYVEILKRELICAMGCTEPIAIAYCAAKARDLLGAIPEKAVIRASGNIIKNVKSVVVPNTEGRRGIKAAAAAGILGGKEEEGLLVIADIPPEVKEQIERLDIPVMVELSSYESHPLGRMEWMRLDGLLLGKSKEADEYFKKKSDLFESAVADEIPDNERKTAAFFSVSPNGYINTRKPGDYISKMIELAGGKYIFTGKDLNVDDNAMSTINIQVETFYESAKDADYLIYNSTVDGRLDSMEQLLEKCSILKDFKAVKEGNVWCTEQNMFQQTTGAADMILDLHTIFMGEANDNEQLSYLHRLK